MRRITSRRGSGDPARAARAPDLLEVAGEGLVDLGALPGHGQDGFEAGGGLFDEPGLLPDAPSGGVGKHRREQVVDPSGHLLGPAVEGVEQVLGVGLLEVFEARVEADQPAVGVLVGVAGDERLEVGQTKLRTLRSRRPRHQVPTSDQRLERGGRKPEQRSRRRKWQHGGVLVAHDQLQDMREKLDATPAAGLENGAPTRAR